MDAITLIGAFSVLGACICMGIGSIGSALGEGRVAASALEAMAQQPDESSNCDGGNHGFVRFVDCVFGFICQSVLELRHSASSIVSNGISL